MAQFHVLAGANDNIIFPKVRHIGVSDLFAALREGLDDFWEKPSHYVFLCLIYPIAGVVLARWTSGANTLPLLYPLMSGFALLGPRAVSSRMDISLSMSNGYYAGGALNAAKSWKSRVKLVTN